MKRLILLLLPMAAVVYANADECAPSADLVAEIKTWRDDPAWSHEPAHARKWNRVLAALGLDSGEDPMPESEIRDNASKWPDSRWAKVAAGLDEIAACEAAAACVPDEDLIAEVEGYAAETHHGTDHVNRFRSVLEALGAGDWDGVEPMSVEKAEEMARIHAAHRWDPIVAELKRLEDCGGLVTAADQTSRTPQSTPVDPPVLDTQPQTLPPGMTLITDRVGGAGTRHCSTVGIDETDGIYTLEVPERAFSYFIGRDGQEHEDATGVSLTCYYTNPWSVAWEDMGWADYERTSSHGLHTVTATENEIQVHLNVLEQLNDDVQTGDRIMTPNIDPSHQGMLLLKIIEDDLPFYTCTDKSGFDRPAAAVVYELPGDDQYEIYHAVDQFECAGMPNPGGSMTPTTYINKAGGYSAGATEIVVDDASVFEATQLVYFDFNGDDEEVRGVSSISGNTLTLETALLNDQADGTKINLWERWVTTHEVSLDVTAEEAGEISFRHTGFNANEIYQDHVSTVTGFPQPTFGSSASYVYRQATHLMHGWRMSFELDMDKDTVVVSEGDGIYLPWHVRADIGCIVYDYNTGLRQDGLRIDFSGAQDAQLHVSHNDSSTISKPSDARFADNDGIVHIAREGLDSRFERTNPDGCYVEPDGHRWTPIAMRLGEIIGSTNDDNVVSLDREIEVAGMHQADQRDAGNPQGKNYGIWPPNRPTVNSGHADYQTQGDDWKDDSVFLTIRVEEDDISNWYIRHDGDQGWYLETGRRIAYPEEWCGYRYGPDPDNPGGPNIPLGVNCDRTWLVVFGDLSGDGWYHNGRQIGTPNIGPAPRANAFQLRVLEHSYTKARTAIKGSTDTTWHYDCDSGPAWFDVEYVSFSGHNGDVTVDQLKSMNDLLDGHVRVYAKNNSRDHTIQARFNFCDSSTAY